jgi:aminobenzoyl-glutamate utilization protein B
LIYLKNPELVEAVKADFKEHLGDYVYEGMVPDGPPPLKSNLQ